MIKALALLFNMVNVQDSGEFLLNIAKDPFLRMLEEALKFVYFVLDEEILRENGTLTQDHIV